MSTGSIIAAAGQIGFNTATQMLDGIDPERFARLPLGEIGVVPTNHPAWAYGHLGLYGPTVLKSLGDQDAAEKHAAPKGWDALFGMGSECRDDPDGSIYPPMSKIVGQFTRSHEAMLAAIQAADDAAFEKAQPNEKMRDRFPTVGASVAFMLTTHVALHVGQVSAWRRMEGMGTALGF